MRKATLLTILIVCFYVTAHSQENALLQYLSTHQSVIERNPDSTLVISTETEKILQQAIKGKKLFVFGEGCSHFLYLNGDLLVLSAKFLSRRGLKYYFVEGARGWAIEDNYFMQHPEIDADTYYHPANGHYRELYETKRKIYQGSKYKIVGIDFERPSGLRKALVLLTQNIDQTKLAALYKIAPYVSDTSYVHDDPKSFTRHYRQLQDDFYRDSTVLKPLLGSNYEDFKYLLTNPNINTPSGARNKPMAENLLNELSPIDKDALYLLDCGMDHSRPNIKGSLVNILSNNEELRGKISVMNVVCDSCTTQVEETSNWAFPVIKGEVMQTFKKAARGNITLFDLSALSEEYDYIKAYGNLLVLAQHQH
ncbi:MAG: hypothetical protein P4L41_03860 [Flavipsychrobacter sp.]|nr:hypothetical protein [Flavipsychrobacter sp.]